MCMRSSGDEGRLYVSALETARVWGLGRGRRGEGVQVEYGDGQVEVVVLAAIEKTGIVSVCVCVRAHMGQHGWDGRCTSQWAWRSRR